MSALEDIKDTAKESRARAMSQEKLGDNIKNAKYAIRGPVQKYAKLLMEKSKIGEILKFDKFHRLNIGNPHILGQPPISFVREVIAVSLCPKLMTSKDISQDAKDRAAYYWDSVEKGALTAYSEGAGFEVFRKSVSKFIEARDGHPSPIDRIFLMNGATDAIESFLTILIDQAHDAVMLPVPEYPGYTFLTVVNEASVAPYYLDEEHDWALTKANLEAALASAAAAKVCPRAIVVINPNNPTGSVLTRANIEDVIRFAYHNSLVILADQVYQENIYDEKFVSFKKVLCEIESPYNEVELATVHSVSKGYMGECGLRGGYIEFHNIDPEVLQHFDKLRDIGCVNIAGCIAVEVMCNPPKKGVNSPEVVEQFEREKNLIKDGLANKAKLLYERLNKMKGLSCKKIAGAMYGFPRIDLPAKAIEEAKKRGLEKDEFFCIQLLENTGIMTVPGSGFGQMPGTYHFRLTNLIWDDKEFDSMLDKLEAFAENFFKTYS